MTVTSNAPATDLKPHWTESPQLFVQAGTDGPGPGPAETGTETGTETATAPPAIASAPPVPSAAAVPVPVPPSTPVPVPVPAGVVVHYLIETETEADHWTDWDRGTTPPLFRPDREVLDLVAETILANATWRTETARPVRVSTWMNGTHHIGHIRRDRVRARA